MPVTCGGSYPPNTARHETGNSDRGTRIQTATIVVDFIDLKAPSPMGRSLYFSYEA